MSPVATSITMATPTFPFISCNSLSNALSAKSCIPTSIVVTMSEPSIGGVSVILRYLFRIFRLFSTPFVPRRILSKESSNPHLATSFEP